MFRSLRRTMSAGANAQTAPAATPAATVAVAPARIAVAAPDTLNQVRVRSLLHQVGVTLQGASGGVVGYDRGDPAHSVTGYVNTAQQLPTTAYAHQRFRDEQRLTDQAVSYDLATTDARFNAYKLNQLARISR